MTNKGRLGAMIAGVTVVCGAGVAIVMSNKQPVAQESFSLSAEVYEEAKFQDLTAAEFERMVEDKRSFIVILRMTVCPAEFPITDVAKQMAQAENLTIYGLMEDEFKQTELAKQVKYLPSAVIYHEGELVDFLDAEADEDLGYYKSVGGFKEWLVKAGVEL